MREGRSIKDPRTENRAPDPHHASFLQVVRSNHAKGYNEVKFEAADVLLPFNVSRPLVKFGLE